MLGKLKGVEINRRWDSMGTETQRYEAQKHYLGDKCEVCGEKAESYVNVDGEKLAMCYQCQRAYHMGALDER